MLREIGDETTFASQPAFILPLNGQAGTEYLYVGDRWNGKNYHDSRYIFLPIRCPQRGRLVLEWAPGVGGYLAPNRKTADKIVFMAGI